MRKKRGQEEREIRKGRRQKRRKEGMKEGRNEEVKIKVGERR